MPYQNTTRRKNRCKLSRQRHLGPGTTDQEPWAFNQSLTYLLIVETACPHAALTQHALGSTEYRSRRDQLMCSGPDRLYAHRWRVPMTKSQRGELLGSLCCILRLGSMTRMSPCEEALLYVIRS